MSEDRLKAEETFTDIVLTLQGIPTLMTDIARLECIQDSVKSCDRCLHDPEIGPPLSDLPFFLPLPNNVEEPPYTYLFVALEPSGNWLRTEAEGSRKVREGYMKFALSVNDYTLFYSISKNISQRGGISG